MMCLLTTLDSPSPSEENFFAGLYRTRDNISNLRVRVRIRKVNNSSSSTASLASAAAEASRGARSGSRRAGSSESIRSSNTSTDDNEPNHQEDEEEMVVFGWQQKVFSYAEFKHYTSKHESDFSEVLQRKLFHDAQALLRKGEKPGPKQRIYTSLDGEIFKGRDEEDQEQDQRQQHPQMTTNPDEEPSVLAQLMMSGLRRRRQRTNLTGVSVSDKMTIPTANIVTEEMSRETRVRLHTLATAAQVMAVRFNLGSEEEDDKKYLDLCVLKYGANGVLEVSPDFTHASKPYRVETNVGERTTYEYWLEHISTPMQYGAQMQEALVLSDVYAKLVQEKIAKVGDKFETVPKRTFRLLLYGELVSAQDFEHDHLFIHYLVDLPLGWSSTSDSQLTGMTHRCSTKADPKNGKDVAHFSHTFHIDLFFDINRFDLDKESLPKWPQIFFEVMSIDSWSRCRAEGYGFTFVPYNAGSYDFSLDTWRPLRLDPKGEMRRYFVGGTPELDDLAYAGTPGETADDKVLSRFGFKTISSGSIRVRLNVAHQSDAFLNEKTPRPMSTIVNKLSSATLFSSVSTVLDAFQKAREKMVRAKEGYEMNLAEENHEKVM